MKKIVAGLAAVVMTAFAVTPASAGVFGNLETLNPNGGTTATNGIKIDYASGNVQVTRKGQQQIFPAQSDVDDNPGYFCGTGVLPDPDQLSCVSSAFAVTMSSENYGEDITIGLPDPYSSFPAPTWDVDWTTVTTESNVASNGSGSIHSVLTYEDLDYCEESCFADIVLDVVLEYTYPNQYYTVTTNLTFSMAPGDVAGYSDDWTARVYYYQDATLSGVDEGNQFQRTDAHGNVLAGVIRPDGEALEGVRAIADNPIHYYAGDYTCPMDTNTSNCPDVTGGWLTTGNNLPDVVDTAEGIDNGFVVQSGEMIVTNDIKNVASDDVSFDLLFMACEVGTSDPTQCIEDGGAGNGLASTGAEGVSSLATTGLLLAVVGVVAVYARRRNARRA